MKQLLADFHFIRPWAWSLIPISIAVWYWWQKASDPLRGWRSQIELALLKSLTVGREQTSSFSGVVTLIAWILAVVSIAGPTWRLEPSPFADDATALMVLLKADASMLAPDPKPSRLERAHLKITDLAQARAGKPVGLIAYAGSAHLVLPPTRDTSIVTTMAAEITPEIMPVIGDRLDLAVREAVRILQQGQLPGTILVLADSVETDLELLERLRSESLFDIQFLEFNSPGSSQSESLRLAARLLNASVERLDVQGGDIDKIVRRASKASLAQGGESTGQWQESGYWFVTIISVLVLLSFRKETSDEVSS